MGGRPIITNFVDQKLQILCPPFYEGNLFKQICFVVALCESFVVLVPIWLMPFLALDERKKVTSWLGPIEIGRTSSRLICFCSLVVLLCESFVVSLSIWVMMHPWPLWMVRKDEKTKEGKSFCSFGKLKERKNGEVSRKIFICNGLFCFSPNLVSFGEKPRLFLYSCITFLQSERAYYFLMGPKCNFMCWACWGWENIFQGDFFFLNLEIYLE